MNALQGSGPDTGIDPGNGHPELVRRATGLRDNGLLIIDHLATVLLTRDTCLVMVAVIGDGTRIIVGAGAVTGATGGRGQPRAL